MPITDDLKQRLDLVQVVSSYVSLSQSGSNLKASCPFHQERTPSFYVFPERGTWRCFGACATGGDVLSFVMKMENLSFGETLKLLAERVGLNYSSPQQGEHSSHLYQVLLAATEFYQEHMLVSKEGKQALSYLADRGVTMESVNSFRLGLSPAGWEGLKVHLVGLGFSEEVGLEAGLLHRSRNGQTRDLFHERLMFPIHDSRGRVVGLGGRSLDGGQPKYLNTPKTAVFDKGGLLYALHQAADNIRREGVAVIVEGYMDVITAHQLGFNNVVASMGVAVTPRQTANLAAVATSVVLVLDSDVAGQEAMLRRLETTWQEFLSARGRATGRTGVRVAPTTELTMAVAVLPEGQDPDQVIRAEPEQWRELVANPQPMLDYLLDAISARFDMRSPQGRHEAAQRLVPLFLNLGNPLELYRYVERTAGLLQVTPETLRASLDGYRVTPARSPKSSASGVTVSAATLGRPTQALEEYTLALLIQFPEIQDRAEALTEDHFQHAQYRALFTEWRACPIIEKLQAQLDVTLRDYLDLLCAKVFPSMDNRKRQDAITQCIRRLEERRLRELKVQEALLLAKEDPGEERGILDEQTITVNQSLRQVFEEGAGRRSGDV